MRALPPGSTIGMLGGGQLGRMTALAAARLGYKTHVFTPEKDSPCAQVSAVETVAAYDNQAALETFAKAVDVVTLEWENIPVGTVQFLAKHVPVHPGAKVLEVAQDRIAEKDFALSLGIGAAPYQACSSPADIPAALQNVGGKGILKSTRMGYDGKGQVRIDGVYDPADVWARMGSSIGIIEGIVPFEKEISVIVARGQDGVMACFPPVENRHKNGILDITIAPASVSSAVSQKALDMAQRLAEALGVVGLLAVEMFVTPDGQVLMNEIAPRPHNSGHWTLDACPCSQFEQHVRAVCGLPLGPVTYHSEATMTNLIGDDVNAWPSLVAAPSVRLHLYGKIDARPGRKMGHYTKLKRRT